MAAAKKAASKAGSSKVPPALRKNQKTPAQMRQMGKGSRKSK